MSEAVRFQVRRGAALLRHAAARPATTRGWACCTPPRPPPPTHTPTPPPPPPPPTPPKVRYYGPGGPGAKEGLSPGDVLLSNHPQLAGGSHLPDITVITPVFEAGRIVFFVARWGARDGGARSGVHARRPLPVTAVGSQS
jgi:hypothetical protein